MNYKKELEDNEQIGKDIIVGQKSVFYEDGRNVISVIINAISVRINMPRGTVKALMACCAALLLAAAVYGASALHTERSAEELSVDETEETAETEAEQAASGADYGSDVVSLKDYVNISAHFYYHIPDNVEDIWEPDDLYAENEMFCDFRYNGNLYTIRSYVVEYADMDLAELMKKHLSGFDNMTFVDEEYIEGRYGEILKLRFEAADEDGDPVVGTGYYWYESLPKICCLEVSTDVWHDDGAEDMIKDSIYRVSSGSTPPYTVYDNSEQYKEEAMDSLAQDALRDYYETEPDISDRIIKP